MSSPLSLINNVHLMASFSLLFPGLIAGDTISPELDQVSGTEGQSVKLRCNYETTEDYVYLYWYKHLSDLQAPQFILWKRAKGDNTEYIPDNRYESQTSDSTTELTIRTLTLADTALYYCALRNTVIQSVEEAVQKAEATYLTPLQRGGKWFSNHSFISHGFCSLLLSHSHCGSSC